MVFLLGLFLVVFSGRALWTDWRDDVAARSEYAELRSSFHLYSERFTETETTLLADMSRFSEINPDFVGWISITGTAVSYPVVQGEDNAHYLETTFAGERNPAGAIFMDYRAAQAFDTPVTLIHGHNMRDGAMFSQLTAFLDPGFLQEHTEITVLTATGETLMYSVFYARRTDAWDSIYTLDFNDPASTGRFETAPPGTSRVLVLSTCTGDGDRHARVLVYAALRVV